MKSSMRDSFIIMEVVAAVIIAVFLFRANRGTDVNPPVINIPQGTVSYTQGDPAEALLAGVTAEDDVDGDVTASLTVASISASGDGKAIAVYEARDNSNNVAAKTRTIFFTAYANAKHDGIPIITSRTAVRVAMDEVTVLPGDGTGTEAGTDAGSAGANDASAGTDADSAGANDASAGTDADSAGTDADSAGTDAGSAGTDADSAGTDSGSAEADDSSADNTEVINADEVLTSYEEKDPYEYTGNDLETIGRALRSETEAEAASLPDGSPKIGLLVHAIQQDVGTSLNPLDLIASIDDAEDPIEYIFGQIHVEGNEGFTTAYPGKYVFKYYVIDSEGNKSNEARLYVLVR